LSRLGVKSQEVKGVVFLFTGCSGLENNNKIENTSVAMEESSVAERYQTSVSTDTTAQEQSEEESEGIQKNEVKTEMAEYSRSQDNTAEESKMSDEQLFAWYSGYGKEDSYINEFAGFRFRVPDDWFMPPNQNTFTNNNNYVLTVNKKTSKGSLAIIVVDFDRKEYTFDSEIGFFKYIIAPYIEDFGEERCLIGEVYEQEVAGEIYKAQYFYGKDVNASLNMLARMKGNVLIGILLIVFDDSDINPILLRFDPIGNQMANE